MVVGRFVLGEWRKRAHHRHSLLQHRATGDPVIVRLTFGGPHAQDILSPVWPLQIERSVRAGVARGGTRDH
jgi:hypothetical protein